MAQAWIIVVGIGLPVIGSGIVLGTVTALPSTFTVTVSTIGAAGFVSVFGIGQAICGLAAIFISEPGRTPLGAWRSSSAAPLATNSSLNFATKLCTGHEQASPKAQIVRPPGILSAIWTR